MHQSECPSFLYPGWGPPQLLSHPVHSQSAIDDCVIALLQVQLNCNNSRAVSAGPAGSLEFLTALCRKHVIGLRLNSLVSGTQSRGPIWDLENSRTFMSDEQRTAELRHTAMTPLPVWLRRRRRGLVGPFRLLRRRRNDCMRRRRRILALPVPQCHSVELCAKPMRRRRSLPMHPEPLTQWPFEAITHNPGALSTGEHRFNLKTLVTLRTNSRP